jgi:DNA repair protein RadC
MPDNESQNQDSLTMRDIPASERPRERLLSHGTKTLSNAELLAIILRTGIAGENVVHLAERILAQCRGLGGLARISQGELEQIPGLGPAKISQILALIELSFRLTSTPVAEQPMSGHGYESSHTGKRASHTT